MADRVGRHEHPLRTGDVRPAERGKLIDESIHPVQTLTALVSGTSTIPKTAQRAIQSAIEGVPSAMACTSLNGRTSVHEPHRSLHRLPPHQGAGSDAPSLANAAANHSEKQTSTGCRTTGARRQRNPCRYAVTTGLEQEQLESRSLGKAPGKLSDCGNCSGATGVRSQLKSARPTSNSQAPTPNSQCNCLASYVSDGR